MATKLAERLKDAGFGSPRIEGLPAADWVLIDAGDVVVHLFRPEVRSFYNLERMWGFGDRRSPLPPEAPELLLGRVESARLPRSQELRSTRTSRGR